MSVSSVEGSPVPTDLPTKYQKLATEYAKMRAQVNVLKKALIEEQGKNSEAHELLKLKEKSIRQSDQEVDSLSFRNQQLTKRVTVLQDELDVLQNKKKSKQKNLPQESETRNHVIDEELQLKIMENANLVSMLEDQKEKTENEKLELFNKIEIYEHEINEYKKLIMSMEEQQKEAVAKIEKENQKLLQHLKTKREEMLETPPSINMNDVICHFHQNKNKYKDMLTFTSKIPLLAILKLYYDSYLKIFNKIFDKSTVKEHYRRLSELVLKFKKSSDVLDQSLKNLILNLESSEEDIKLLFNEIFTNFNSFNQAHGEIRKCISSCSQEENAIMKNEKFASNNFTLIEAHEMFCQSLVDVSSSLLLSLINSDRNSSGVESTIQVMLSVVSKLISAVKVKCDILKIDDKIGAKLCSYLEDFREFCVKLLSGYKENFPPESLKKNQPSQEDIEYWKQELQLLKISHSKKVKDLEGQLASLSGTITPQSAASPVEDCVQSDNKMSNTFGLLSMNSHSEEYESEIKKYFTTRVNTLMVERQLAESKTTTMRTENESLRKRLEDCLDNCKALELALEQSQDTISRLQEEMTTTTSNYETQLSSMTEHMANMNDRVMAQQEEIDQLKYLLENKDARKGKK